MDPFDLCPCWKTKIKHPNPSQVHAGGGPQALRFPAIGILALSGRETANC